MKTFLRTFSLAAALMLAIFAGQVRAQDTTAAGDGSVSFQTFYDQLANQGTWIQSDKYGYVFQPTENDPNWRPYTYGHWVNTDAGMTWVSDESFGWATYHYGRWANLDGTGWVWVPGYTWAPAWVSWRDGDDEVGWAPLPPDSGVGIDYYGDGDFFGDLGFGFHIGDDCDVAYGIGAGWYNFCPVAYIGDRDSWRHFRNYHDNYAFIGHTRNVTNINFRRDGAGRFGRVHEGGPSVAALNEHARNHIETARLTSATTRGEAGQHGNSLAVFAPRVDRNSIHDARPGNVSEHLANANVNRGTDINRPLAVNSRVHGTNATAEQIHAASVAQANVSSSARIATANTRPSRGLTQPLSSFRTTTGRNDERSNAVAGTTHQATPAASTESRFTGASVAEHGTASSSGESRFTGEPITHRESTAAPAESRFTGGDVGARAVTPSHTASSYHATATPSGAESFRSSSVYHPSASVYHSQASAPVYHPQSSFHSSEPAYHPQASFHPSAPAYHPQPSFHASAPASHPAPSFHAVAPAAHFSGSGGGHPSGGGGGGAHASAGPAHH